MKSPNVMKETRLLNLTSPNACKNVVSNASIIYIPLSALGVKLLTRIASRELHLGTYDFLGFYLRPFQNSYALNRDCFYTVNAVVDQVKGTKKTLILHEIQEDDVEEFLSSKESLASCNIAIFVYDG
ncbi:hypothetical protein L2E82_43209 [Cichorium intybus]|uniref:Uncharacterized protein n=1 Tax=Cichorium intybus TaxID=13427 RepID=A0ACB8ZMC0_CICIN|nr:hypothetical protein L2E82_43209 [Cichorium intybus]